MWNHGMKFANKETTKLDVKHAMKKNDSKAVETIIT